MSGSEDVGKTEFMPSEEGKTEYMPSEEGKTEFMPSEESKTEYMPSEEGKTEYMPSEEGKTEFMPTEEPEEKIEVAEPKQKSRLNNRRVQTEKHTYTIHQEGVYQEKKVYKVTDEANHVYVLFESRIGGDSDIYIAQDAKGTKYFVKEYRHDYENKDIFEIVGEYLKNNTSPGISKLLDYGELHEIDDRDRVSPISKWYFVYPQYKLITSKPDDETFVKWVEVLNEALHEIHTNGRLVHRDIKPANLMLDPTTNLPVIIDFDAAALLDRKAGDRVYAETNGAFLTPEYASPETRNESSGYAEPASDYFSLGVTLAELYSGMNLQKQSLFKDARDLNRQVLYNEISFPTPVEENPNVLKLVKSLMCYKSRERAGYDEICSWVNSPSDYHFTNSQTENIAKFHYEIGTEAFESPEALAEYFSTHSYDCIMQWENGGLFRYIEKIRDDYKPIYDGFYEIKSEYEKDKDKYGEVDGRTIAPWQKAYVYAFIHILDPYTGFAWNDVVYPYSEIQKVSEAIVNEVVKRGNEFDPLFESEFAWRYRLRLGKEESDRELHERMNLVSGFGEMEMKKLLFAEALYPGIIVKKISGGKAKSAAGFIKQYMDLLRNDIINGGIDRAGQHFYIDNSTKSLFAEFVNLCNRSYMIDAILVSGGYGNGYGKLLSEKYKKEITLRDLFNSIAIISAFSNEREKFAKDVLSSGQGIIEYFLWHMRHTEHNKWFVGNGELAFQNMYQIYSSIKSYNDIVYESSSPTMWRALGEFFSNLKEKIDTFYDFLIFDDDIRKAYLAGTGKRTNYIICGKTGISVFTFWKNYRIASLIKTDLNEKLKGLMIDTTPLEYKDEDVIPGEVKDQPDNKENTSGAEAAEWTEETCTAYLMAMSRVALFEEPEPEPEPEIEEPATPPVNNDNIQRTESEPPKKQSNNKQNEKKKSGGKKGFIIAAIIIFGLGIGIGSGVWEDKKKDDKKTESVSQVPNETHTQQNVNEAEVNAPEEPVITPEPGPAQNDNAGTISEYENDEINSDDQEVNPEVNPTGSLDFSKYNITEEQVLLKYQGALIDETNSQISYVTAEEPQNGFTFYTFKEGNNQIGQIALRHNNENYIDAINILSPDIEFHRTMFKLIYPTEKDETIQMLIDSLQPNSTSVKFLHIDTMYYDMSHLPNSNNYLTYITSDESYVKKKEQDFN